MQNLKPIFVSISNFQSIEHIEFEINGFTAITGKTNIGKSAIVRAISSALLNNSVIGMVRKGASHATVIIRNGDNEIKWEKAERGINRYTINGKVYDKVGGKQLKEIRDLGYSSVKIGNDEIFPWLASQFSPIFLLDKTGSQVTDFISEVSRLNTIQNAMVIANKGKRSYQHKSEEKKEDHKKELLNIEQFDNLDDVKLIMGDLKDQKASIKSYEDKISICESSLNAITGSAEKLKSYQNIGKVVIPDDYKEDVNTLANKSTIYNNLSKNATKIIPIRGINSVSIPDHPTEIKELEEMSRHLGLELLVESIDGLRNVTNVKISDEVDLDGLRDMVLHANTINKLNKSVSSISVPEVSSFGGEDVKVFSDLVQILETLNTNALEAGKLIQKQKSINSELSDVDNDISAIPVCPTCNIPGGSAHVIQAHTT